MRLARADSLVAVCFRARSPAGSGCSARAASTATGVGRIERARVDGEGSGSIRVPALTLGGDSKGGAARRGGATRAAEVATRVGATRPLAARWRAPATGAAADTVHADMFYRGVRLEVPCNLPRRPTKSVRSLRARVSDPRRRGQSSCTRTSRRATTQPRSLEIGFSQWIGVGFVIGHRESFSISLGSFVSRR